MANIKQLDLPGRSLSGKDEVDEVDEVDKFNKFDLGKITFTLDSSIKRIQQYHQSLLTRIEQDSTKLKKLRRTIHNRRVTLKRFDDEIATKVAKNAALDNTADFLTEELDELHLDLKRAKDQQTSYAPICCICMDSRPNVVLIPCGHVCLCEQCNTGSLTLCPLCRTHITSSLVVYF